MIPATRPGPIPHGTPNPFNLPLQHVCFGIKIKVPLWSLLVIYQLSTLQLVPVGLPWRRILGQVVTGSGGRKVKWRDLFERSEFSATSAVHLEPVTWPIQRQKGTPTGTGIRLVIKKLDAIALGPDFPLSLKGAKLQQIKS